MLKRFFPKIFLLIAVTLLGASSYAFENLKLLGGNSGIDDFNFQDNDLYAEIEDYFNQNRERIISRQLERTEQGRDLAVIGGLNHIGINFNKGFGSFSIELNRNVAPDLFDDERWLVTDTFTLYIDASKLLGNLRDDGIIDISEKSLAAFAGITFKRAYTHIHFANTYEEALGFNLDKLFFSYKNFREGGFRSLHSGEVIQKEDSFSLQAGGIAGVPLTTGLAAHMGALVKYQSLIKTNVHRPLEDEKSYEEEGVRINSEKSSELKLGASAGVIADFLGVLQVTLLRLDYSYKLNESYKVYLSIPQKIVDGDSFGNSAQEEISKVLKHQKPKRSILAPFLVSEERRREEEKRFKYSILIYGAHKDTKTSHIEIVKDGFIKTFFRHNFEKSKYFENIFSRFFNVVVNSFLKVQTIVNKSRSESEKVRIEYSADKNLINSKEDLIIDINQEKLSMNFSREFYAFKLTKNAKKDLFKNLDHFSGSSTLITERIEKGELVGPMNFSSLFSLNYEGLQFFHDLSTGEVYDIIEDSCQAQRKGFFSWFKKIFKSCERGLKREYDLYQKEWRVADYSSAIYKSCKADLKRYKSTRNLLSSRRKRTFLDSCMQRKSIKSEETRSRELPIWRLAKLSTKLHQEVPSKVHYYRLFGLKNVHVHGEIDAFTREGLPFQHNFREGLFKGIGIVQNYQKNQSLRSPESVNHL